MFKKLFLILIYLLFVILGFTGVGIFINQVNHGGLLAILGAVTYIFIYLVGVCVLFGKLITYLFKTNQSTNETI